jgi:hypothetical protein
MHYPSLRYAFEDSKVEGAGRLILLAIAYRADGKSGESWAGYRHLAKLAGVANSTAQECLATLVALGEIEVLEEASGPHPRRYRITASAPAGSAQDPESVHRPSVHNDELVHRSGGASAPIRGELVHRSGGASAPAPSSLPAETVPKVFKVLEQGEKHVRAAAASTALAVGGTRLIDNLDVAAAVRHFDPGAIREDGFQGGGWHLSERHGRAWLKDADVAGWLFVQLAQAKARQEQERLL